MYDVCVLLFILFLKKRYLISLLLLYIHVSYECAHVCIFFYYIIFSGVPFRCFVN